MYGCVLAKKNTTLNSGLCTMLMNKLYIKFHVVEAFNLEITRGIWVYNITGILVISITFSFTNISGENIIRIPSGININHLMFRLYRTMLLWQRDWRLSISATMVTFVVIVMVTIFILVVIVTTVLLTTPFCSTIWKPDLFFPQ